MSIRNGIFRLVLICSDGLGVTFRYAHLIYRVADRFSGCILCKSCPAITPVVCFVKRHLFSGLLAVCIKLHGDACRADFILVVAVFPDLSYADACVVRRSSNVIKRCVSYFFSSFRILMIYHLRVHICNQSACYRRNNNLRIVYRCILRIAAYLTGLYNFVPIRAGRFNIFKFFKSN